MDTSDQATGLPPLEILEPEVTMLVLGLICSEGLAAGHTADRHESVAVVYLHARGLTQAPDEEPIVWSQVHLAVPTTERDQILRAFGGVHQSTTESMIEGEHVQIWGFPA